ncbi:MAG: redoxin domain-containing protein [Chloroflexi bacterium]|nr:redoxin domain-containing protein [Chloroflexota bacterium]
MRADYEKIHELDAEILAISNDSIESHCSFAEKLGGLSFPHLSDVDLRVTQLYDVVNDRGTGCRRALFVVDRDGTARHVNRAYNVSDDAQYRELFEVLARI